MAISQAAWAPVGRYLHHGRPPAECAAFMWFTVREVKGGLSFRTLSVISVHQQCSSILLVGRGLV